MTSRIVFQQEMEKLNEEVTQMANLAREAIVDAVECIVERDCSRRPEVERLDREIYRLEQVIEKRCLDVIALHTPVASDLRTVSTCLKIITDLNRIGRYASDIVEVYDHLDSFSDFRNDVNISYMGELVVAMVADATRSFTDRDAELARELFERDDEVDRLYEVNFRTVLTYMMEDPRRITVGTNWILVSRYLERIADHSCNIGERVVYMVTAERMDPKDRKHKNGHLPKATEAQPPQGGYATHDLEDK